MKNILILLLMFLTFSAASQTYTNGVYFEKGQTIEIDKKVHQIVPKLSSEILYFSNEFIVKLYTNSDFTINSFFQDVSNTNNTPEKLTYVSSNFAGTLMEGSMIVTYTSKDENSSCVISTPMIDIELSSGTFYFKVNSNAVFVYALEGTFKFEDNKKEQIISEKHALIAIPNELINTKVSLSSQNLNTEVVDKLNTESKDIINFRNKIIFALINGKIVGININ